MSVMWFLSLDTMVDVTASLHKGHISETRRFRSHQLSLA